MTDKTQLAFHFDQTKCNGCKACHIACKSKSDANIGEIPRRVYEYVGGGCVDNGDNTFTTTVFGYYTSVGCNHCSEPVCVKACPTGAMYKQASDGLVKIDQSVCIGCGSCAQACPYDAPQLDTARQVMTKCDGCSDRLAQGKQPYCVASCTQRALDFGTVDEMISKYPNAARADTAPLPSVSITTPNLFISANPNAKASGSAEGYIINLNEV
ncbi:DMSO/selenate family reductase complex B subunit [Ferrimonas lipolytica]|uniref:Dimethylsulfoxide reductase subunit B n=1 Tax=Ferrimonas lipolytica TaxID=2724191 RepID=A0A6H1UD62_9GAMM|nr:DMSO/selenate family reductase complex B subunit [Ferrimonas lipolytica]QIZ76293.1 dimethylsulfoxide reductase subunit B [Ferrimonas lipolytica]